jgi:hypothetical protein
LNSFGFVLSRVWAFLASSRRNCDRSILSRDYELYKNNKNIKNLKLLSAAMGRYLISWHLSVFLFATTRLHYLPNSLACAFAASSWIQPLEGSAKKGVDEVKLINYHSE